MKLKNIIFLIFFTILLSGCSLFPGKKARLTDNTNFSSISPSSASLPMGSDNLSALTVDTILTRFKQISGTEVEPKDKSFLYNTQIGEITIVSKGYSFNTSDYNKETLRQIRTDTVIYLKDLGFETDMYNASSGAPGHRVDKLKVNDVCCQLRLIEDMEKGEANLDFSCGIFEDGAKNQLEHMSLKEAVSIAETSTCVETGSLNTNKTMYNENSKTWWIDLLVEGHEGCNPACVVSADKSAKINWRCTGLIPE